MGAGGGTSGVGGGERDGGRQIVQMKEVKSARVRGLSRPLAVPEGLGP